MADLFPCKWLLVMESPSASCIKGPCHPACHLQQHSSLCRWSLLRARLEAASGQAVWSLNSGGLPKPSQRLAPQEGTCHRRGEAAEPHWGVPARGSQWWVPPSATTATPPETAYHQSPLSPDKAFLENPHMEDPVFNTKFTNLKLFSFTRASHLAGQYSSYSKNAC